MTVIIPQTKRWTQNNTGDVFGILHSTRNINFDKEGYAQLAKRPMAVFYNVSNFETLIACDYVKASSNSGYFALTAGRVFTFNLATAAPTDLNAAGAAGGIKLDACVWQGRWYLSQDTSFSYRDVAAGTWTTGLGSLTTGKQHPMCVWESANYLCIGDGSSVLIYNTSHTLVTTVTIPSNYEVRWIRYNHQRIFIGTKNTSGGDAVMFVCSDSTATAADSAWPVSANWLYSGVIYKSSIVVTTSRGQVLRFNGGGWDELANFPVYYSNYSWYQGSGYTNGRMEQRGMATDGNVIYLNIDGYAGDDNVLLDNQPSGLWVYDPLVGLYHKAGISNDKQQIIDVTEASTNTTTDVLTAGSSFNALTGTKLFYKASSASGGLVSGHYYYMIRVNSTTFKVASSYANAIAGTQIDITSAGTSEFFYYVDEFDAGGTFDTVLEPGAVCMVSELDANPVTSGGYGYFTGSQVLYGWGNVEQNVSGNADSLQSIIPSYNRGDMVTQKIFSNQLREAWKNLVVKATRLFQTSDKIVVKYRTSDKAYYPIFAPQSGALDATWSDSDTFTSTSDLFAVVAGEEVEFVSGRSAGFSAHVSSISVNAGTYTVNLDETMPGVSANDKSGFIVTNFKKLGTLSSTDPDNLYEKLLPVNPKKWIQLKIEFRGHSEPIIEELQAIGTVNQPSK